MKRASTLLLLSSLSMAVLATGCSHRLEEAQYWQRKEATSALYLRGPKAQQSLHMDISTCANELSEMERVGALRESIPADLKKGRVPGPPTIPEDKMAKWNTPERDGALYTEYLPYHDFETCMDAKGWERVESLPYAKAEEARGEYLETVYGYQYQDRYGKHSAPLKPTSADSYESSPTGTVNN